MEILKVSKLQRASVNWGVVQKNFFLLLNPREAYPVFFFLKFAKKLNLMHPSDQCASAPAREFIFAITKAVVVRFSF